MQQKWHLHRAPGKEQKQLLARGATGRTLLWGRAARPAVGGRTAELPEAPALPAVDAWEPQSRLR